MHDRHKIQDSRKRHHLQLVSYDLRLLVCFGHNIHVAASRSRSATIRMNGKYGPMNAKKKPTPMREAGSRMHAGQMSVSAPMNPANPVTRFMPAGQLPSRLCHTARPVLNERSNPKNQVNISSHVIAGERGILGRTSRRYPSSHAKKMPTTIAVTRKGSQNDEERRTRNTYLIIADFAFMLNKKRPGR